MINYRQKISLSSPTGLAVKMERRHVSKTEYVPVWSRFITSIHAFFTGSFETDWEKKTRMLWKEWRD